MSETITPVEAAAQAGRWPHTIIHWCKQHPALGRKVAGRWQIDASKLQRVLDGTPLDQL
jgi:hypothetical protein